MSNVQHFVSVEPDTHVITRARVMRLDKREEVSLFSHDTIVGVLQLERGGGQKLCEQLCLIERQRLWSYDDVAAEFERAMRE